MKFQFGKNWISYSQKALTLKSIDEARQAFSTLFDGLKTKNKRFLDIGFGQGLTLIIAAEFGAEVYGFDIDKDNLQALAVSMEFAKTELKINAEIASVLDDKKIDNLAKNKFDIVHSWGVLHHTGEMAKAVENACKLVAEDGFFVCAIYNKHWSSPIWKVIKWVYNFLPEILKKTLIGIMYPIILSAKWIVTRENPFIMGRGMDFLHNVVDWVGGYPYEYASVDEFVTMVTAHGFECVNVFPSKVPTGCNEFVFKKSKY